MIGGACFLLAAGYGILALHEGGAARWFQCSALWVVGIAVLGLGS